MAIFKIYLLLAVYLTYNLSIAHAVRINLPDTLYHAQGWTESDDEFEVVAGRAEDPKLDQSAPIRGETTPHEAQRVDLEDAEESIERKVKPAPSTEQAIKIERVDIPLADLSNPPPVPKTTPVYYPGFKLATDREYGSWVESADKDKKGQRSGLRKLFPCFGSSCAQQWLIPREVCLRDDFCVEESADYEIKQTSFSLEASYE